MTLIIALCLVTWIVVSIVPLPPPWYQIVGVVLIIVLIFACLGFIRVTR
jgi:hypothetical protein